MKSLALLSLLSLGLGSVSLDASAQVAGSTTVGIAIAQLQEVATGWSARKQILGHTIVNEEGETVGKVDDLIVTPSAAVSFAIVGAGGFVGLKRHQVAIPIGQLTPRPDGDFLLAGATKAAIKSLPPFEYAKP